MITSIRLLAVLLALLAVAPCGSSLYAQKGKQKKGSLKQSADLPQHKRTDTVGIVNGEVITFGDFNGVMSGFLRLFTQRSGDNLVTDSLYSKIVDSAWVKMERDIVIEQEIRKRKLSMTDAEVLDSIIAHPPAELMQQFIDSSGFHRREFEQGMRDPRNDSIVKILIGPWRAEYELRRLKNAVVSQKDSDAARDFDEWLRKKVAKAKVIDRRLSFGFY